MGLASCNFIIFSMLQIIYSFDTDYYFSSPLRSRETNCVGVKNVLCQLKCGTISSLCVKNECYCLTLTSPDNNGKYDESEVRSPDDRDVDFEDDEHSHITNKEIEDESLQFRPALRHHIAHFCPNIDIARECIKKCIAIGKPAFCGKDHVCYCGHKYEHMEDDAKSNSNAKDIYAQFKDLYLKYFGLNGLSLNDDNDSS